MSGAPPDVRRDHERLGAALARCERLLEERGAALWRREPAVSAWSPAEHLFHVALANELSLKNVRSLVEGKGLLVKPYEGTPAEALDVLRRGRIPSGVAKAPRFVTPPARFELERLEELQRDNAKLSRSLALALREPLDTTRAVRHQLLGELTAPLWLRFARVHTAHHLRIASRVLRTFGLAPSRG